MKFDIMLKTCQRCSAACCKMGGPDFSKSEMEKVLKAGYKNFFVKLNNNHYELKCKKGICPYLKEDNSCLIHKVRPLMCKCLPLTINYKNNKKEIMVIECPLTPLLSKQGIQIMKRQINRIPKKMLYETFSHSKFSKSDLKLVQARYNKFKRRKLK